MGNRSRSKTSQKASASETKSSVKGKHEAHKLRMRQRSQRKSRGILAYSMFAVVILAIVVGVLWKQPEQTGEIDSLRSFMTSFVCQDPNGGYCNDALVPVGRTQKAKRYFSPKEIVLVVPRHLQIWDLDALRDEFVQSELSKARHGVTGNPLDSGAHLAAYLVRRYAFAKQNHPHNVTHVNEIQDDPMFAYFEILPSYQDLTAFHPVTWTEQDLAESLGGRKSSSFLVAKAHRDMVISEYKAFSSVSSVFRNDVKLEEYMRMRIHVMSRSFGPGPPGPEEHRHESTFATLQDELKFLQQRFGVDLSQGCRAMVPILDMYNHHARPNVEWRYMSDKRAFVIYTSAQGIAPGHEVVDSYGKYTDSHLFSKFGFVNGDGSGYTQASIAVLHRLLDVGLSKQFSYLPLSTSVNNETVENIGQQSREKIVRYLQFDDGHAECIHERRHRDAFELKRLKFQLLLRISNSPDRWTLFMPPRDPEISPAKSSNLPTTMNVPKFDYNNLQFDGSTLISTCRLMVLTNDDYNGSAKDVLEKVLENSTANSFIVGRQSDALEFRALECLVRLSAIALQQFKTTVSEETNLVSTLTREAFQSRNWTTAHVRLGEMQSLELLHGLSLSGMRQLGKNIPTQDLVQRKQPCPWEFSKPLLQPTVP